MRSARIDSYGCHRIKLCSLRCHPSRAVSPISTEHITPMKVSYIRAAHEVFLNLISSKLHEPHASAPSRPILHKSSSPPTRVGIVEALPPTNADCCPPHLTFSGPCQPRSQQALATYTHSVLFEVECPISVHQRIYELPLKAAHRRCYMHMHASSARTVASPHHVGHSVSRISLGDSRGLGASMIQHAAGCRIPITCLHAGIPGLSRLLAQRIDFASTIFSFSFLK